MNYRTKVAKYLLTFGLFENITFMKHCCVYFLTTFGKIGLLLYSHLVTLHTFVSGKTHIQFKC